ncbi:hypothetical protein SRHO_G00171440 [Serrasalmus rhombeus]
MESHYHQQQRYDSSGQGRENKTHRKKGFVVGAGTSAHGAYGSEEGEKKPKFVPARHKRAPLPYFSREKH